MHTLYELEDLTFVAEIQDDNDNLLWYCQPVVERQIIVDLGFWLHMNHLKAVGFAGGYKKTGSHALNNDDSLPDTLDTINEIKNLYGVKP